MRYAVEPADLRRAAAHVAGVVVPEGLVSRHLDAVGAAVPRGTTAAALAQVGSRWRARERRVAEGIAARAAHLARAAEGYEQVEKVVGP